MSTELGMILKTVRERVGLGPQERRRRVKRPRFLSLIAWFLIILPFLNLLTAKFSTGIPFAELHRVALAFPVFGLLLLCAAPVVGFALLQVSRWAWYLFLGYGALFVVYTGIVWWQHGEGYRLATLIRVILGFGLAFLLLRRDIYAPYLALFPRGFRRARRFHEEIPVAVAGTTLRSIDTSSRGFYVSGVIPGIQPGDAVSLTWNAKGETLSAVGGVVRIDDAGMGIAIRGKAKKEPTNSAA